MKQEQEKAKIIAALLNRGVASLDEATLDRLATVRNKAVAAMPQKALGVEQEFAGIGKFVATYFHEHRLQASMLALLGMVLGTFILLQGIQNHEPVGADALLLASDLPPEAYADKGFDTWLKQSSRH